MGIANQRETTVVWERATGRPIYRAIVWQSKQTTAICKRLQEEGQESLVKERTGLRLDPYFSGSKVRWILDHVEGAQERAKRGELLFGTVDTWLIWNLTGGKVHVTDRTNASRTLLLNIHTLEWDKTLLSLFDIPAAMMPQVKRSSEIIGETVPQLFGRALPIVGVAGDQQAALFGQGCNSPGMAKNTYGTGCFVMMQTREKLVPSTHGLLSTVACSTAHRAHYALEGSIFVAGAVIQWLRDELGLLKASAESEALALSVPSTGGVYLVPAFSGLGAPYWDAEARGAIFGLTRGSTRAHLVRAALESVAYQTADVLQAMEADAGYAIKELRVDGGASANHFLMQFQADLLGVPVARGLHLETTALGAAYLAGLAVGYWQEEKEIAALWSEAAHFSPQITTEKREARMKDWRQAVKGAMRYPNQL